MQNPVHEHADLALALLVDVVQTNLVNVELVLAQGDGLDDAGGKGGSATTQSNDHCLLLLLNCVFDLVAHLGDFHAKDDLDIIAVAVNAAVGHVVDEFVIDEVQGS